jgi:dolichol-phosphate mannosyltransferase
MRSLVAIPVYNEERHVREVLDRVLGHVGNVLVVDDGSSDGTPNILREYPVDVIRHAVNRGYGRSLRDAFNWAISDGYDWVITMDCDAQHEPDEIPIFLDAAAEDNADIISGSRYLLAPSGAGVLVPSSGGPSVNGSGSAPSLSVSPLAPPPDRRAINAAITAELNQRLGPALTVPLTDSFCGFKAYRVSTLKDLDLTLDGYAFPMQFWVQAVAAGARIREVPVSLIYNDPNRSFGGPLDDPSVRLAHYRDVMHREIRRQSSRLPSSAATELSGGRCCCR